jgi:hypothetical protein
VKEIHEIYEREVRDLPCFQFRTTVVIELYRVRCPDCGVKTERVAQLPSKAPFSKRFEEAVGEACESAPARQVARRMALAASTVRAIDKRVLERWAARRRQPPAASPGCGRTVSRPQAEVRDGGQHIPKAASRCGWARTAPKKR